MPAPKLFLTSADISGITGMSKRSAQYVLNALDRKGMTVHYQHGTRSKLVDVDLFTAYLCEQDGQDPAVRKKGIMEYLREAGSRHTRKKIS